MTDTPHKPVKESAAVRQDRLRQALRDNLKRRKLQSRGRANSVGAALPVEPSQGGDPPQDIASRPADPDQD